MMAKRFFDIVASAAALVVLTPVIAAIAVWIALDSRGPVFFRQNRVGRFGAEFRIYKFRTMVDGAEDRGPGLTIGNDARITSSGEFLRRTKLDELPQLINVLKGEMSIVGPRPELPRYVRFYPPDVRERVLSVRPGITDEASIEFADESELLSRASDPDVEYVREILPRKLRLATEYIKTPTLLGDLRIILRTIARIVRK